MSVTLRLFLRLFLQPCRLPLIGLMYVHVTAVINWFLGNISTSKLDLQLYAPAGESHLHLSSLKAPERDRHSSSKLNSSSYVVSLL